MNAVLTSEMAVCKVTTKLLGLNPVEYSDFDALINDKDLYTKMTKDVLLLWFICRSICAEKFIRSKYLTTNSNKSTMQRNIYTTITNDTEYFGLHKEIETTDVKEYEIYITRQEINSGFIFSRVGSRTNSSTVPTHVEVNHKDYFHSSVVTKGVGLNIDTMNCVTVPNTLFTVADTGYSYIAVYSIKKKTL